MVIEPKSLSLPAIYAAGVSLLLARGEIHQVLPRTAPVSPRSSPPKKQDELGGLLKKLGRKA